MSILDLFCSVDTFWQAFEPWWDRERLASGRYQRKRATRMHHSAIMTILIRVQHAGYRTFKGFDTQYVQRQPHAEFPQPVRYSRFVAMIPRVLLPLAAYLQTQLGDCTGISFVDSTSLAVCHNPRIAARGKTSVGWFSGFKLHLVVNDRGELLAFCLAPGNVDDPRPVSRLARRLFGTLFDERGYISQALAERLFTTQGLVLITRVRKNMRERLLATTDKLLLRKLAISERVNDQLKNVCQIEHSRHRSPYNFLAHLLAGLIAYCHQPKKPSLHVDRDLDLLAAG